MSNQNSTPKSNHVLVTGGSGYIGSHTVLALLDAGHRVTIFDKENPNKVFGDYIINLETCKFVKGDLLDDSLIRKVIQEGSFDGVIHFAADPAFVSQEPIFIRKYYTNNVVSSINLVNACQELGLNNFVFSSTAAMYGIPEILPIIETSKLQPINVYGYTKSVIETMLVDFANAYKFDSIRLRYFNASGADKACRTGEAHDPEVHLIPNILKSVGSDKVFKLFGDDYNTKDGTNVRDYIHVSDLASAHVLALDILIANNSAENICEVINLGTGSGFSNKDIFDTAKRIIGQDIAIEIVERRAGDPDELVADNSKAKTLLNWTPTNSTLENIISTAWKWEQSYKK